MAPDRAQSTTAPLHAHHSAAIGRPPCSECESRPEPALPLPVAPMTVASVPNTRRRKSQPGWGFRAVRPITLSARVRQARGPANLLFCIALPRLGRTSAWPGTSSLLRVPETLCPATLRCAVQGRPAWPDSHHWDSPHGCRPSWARRERASHGLGGLGRGVCAVTQIRWGRRLRQAVLYIV